MKQTPAQITPFPQHPRLEPSTLEEQLAAVERDNQRLRTALAEAEAKSAPGGHAFLLRDALCVSEEPLTYAHDMVRGRVSVIIPAYNAGHFIERSVRSVWQQKFPADRIEILVVDDGSSDDTRAIATRLAANSPVAMRVLTHPGGRNRGVAPSRQLAATESTGEFIALLDADDGFMPMRLKTSVAALTRDTWLAAVCSLGRNVDSSGKTIVGHNGTTVAGQWRTLNHNMESPFTFEQLWNETPIANSSLTIRRTALGAVGGFPTLMAHQAEDWLLVLKLSLLASIPCIEKELILYTHHGDAYTQNYHNNGWRAGARLELFYHVAWWMLNSAPHAEAGSKFFRREYPKQVAEHQRFLPLVRDYYAGGGRPASGPVAFGEHLEKLTAEVQALRRVCQAKVHENKQLRHVISRLAEAVPEERRAHA
jgi:GT2 family glycosyltransferase